MQSPTAITDEETYWLRSQAVSDDPAIAGDGYFAKHGVTRAADVTSADLPPADDEAVREILWAAKAMTETGYERLPYDEYMIAVYTPNYFDTDDVFRVREHLREEYGVSRDLYYKPDIYTGKGIVAETAGEFGLEKTARYVA